MARRLPSTPPTLPGFSFSHVLGSGGFADVFLYEQNMPRRQVAVKVMLREIVDESARQMFQAETNLMAQLSAHPSILTVYEAGVSADGRPYLVMEPCAAGLAGRYRSERIPVPEVLRVAIKIGSAIETAHRAGVLHRDIKPSNILMTAYGHPVLSDFGIASTLSGAREQESVGLSVPWSAPEVLLDETAGTLASEVWSFAATVYSLLAGRSPFEIVDGDNSSAELLGRIVRAKPQPIGRPDVPAALEQLLRRGLARDPAKRPATVLELVRELQAIETGLGLAQTPAEVARDDWAFGAPANPDERTLLRPAVASPGLPRSRRRRPTGANDAPALAQPTPAHRPVRLAAPTRALVWALAASAALAVLLGAVAIIMIVNATAQQRIPVVRDIQASVAGGAVEFSWADPGIEPDDRYQVSTRQGGDVFESTGLQSAGRFVVDAAPGDTVCITVRVNRQGSVGDASAEKCVEIPEG